MSIVVGLIFGFILAGGFFVFSINSGISLLSMGDNTPLWVSVLGSISIIILSVLLSSIPNLLNWFELRKNKNASKNELQ